METATPPRAASGKFTKREVHTEDMRIAQPDSVVLPPLHEAVTHDPVIIEAPADALQKSYADALEFAEQPVTIRLERGREKFAPSFIEAWVNGKGIEIWMNNRWIETKGIPVARPVTIKRKYVEVLARSFIDTVSTEVVHPENPHEDVLNKVNRSTSSSVTFSIVHDPSPKGAEWLTRILGFAN